MKFKNKKDEELFFLLHPIVAMIAFDMDWYAVSNFGKELTITATVSTKEEDKALNRKSSSHQRGVAFDLRTRDLKDTEITSLLAYINGKWAYREYHYLSFSGKKRLAVYHNNGNGDHFHVQIHSRYSLDPI